MSGKKVLCTVLVCDDVGLDTVVTVFVVVSLVSIYNDVIGYIELLSVEFIVFVTRLVEDGCESVIELILLGILAVNIFVDESVSLILVIEFIEDDIGNEELVIINGSEVITTGDSVLPEIELLLVVSVLSLSAKIKEKRPVNIVVSHNRCPLHLLSIHAYLG